MMMGVSAIGVDVWLRDRVSMGVVVGGENVGNGVGSIWVRSPEQARSKMVVKAIIILMICDLLM